MRIRVNFTYVTSLLVSVDVMTRHYPARQHTWARCRYTHTGNASVGQETPTSCQLFKPAWFKAHTADTGAVSLARRLWRFTQYPTRDALRPPKTTQYIYKNNLSPIQFVLASTYYTKCIPNTKT